MARATLTRRVEVLEQTVGELTASPPARLDRVERKLGEFRAEVRQEFGSVRTDFRVGGESVRSDLHAEIRGSAESVRSELREENRATQTMLLAAIRDGDEDTRRYMRLLHEDLVGRIATLGEGR